MNGFMRITAAAILLLIILGGSLPGVVDAMNWPSENAVLVRNFGSNNRGWPVLGMVFEGETKVLAADRGEVIFSRGRNASASRLPSPLGAWVAVDHEDGLISIYSRFDGEETPFEYTTVEKLQPIASSGVSGWSARNGFYFIVFDRRERRWVNPAMIITPVRETRPVRILSVDLRDSQGLTAQSRNLGQGRYKVIVNASSAAQGGPTAFQYAPQRIVCSINGAEVGSLNFEAVSARDGVLMVYRNGLVPAKQIYAAFPAFEVAEVFLTRGQANLEIIAQNIAGASVNLVNRLNVN